MDLTRDVAELIPDVIAICFRVSSTAYGSVEQIGGSKIKGNMYRLPIISSNKLQRTSQISHIVDHLMYSCVMMIKTMILSS